MARTPTPNFALYLRERVASIWQDIFRHPFIQEIQASILPVEKFRFYLVQDYHYLGAFARAIAIAAGKTTDDETLQLLTRRLTTPVERSMHHRLFEMIQVTQEEVQTTKPAPTNLAYMNHLLTTAHKGNLGQLAAALLPCPWTYHELGERMRITGNPVYDAWSSVYRDGGLLDSVTSWSEVVNRMIVDQDNAYLESVESAFVTSSRYEYLFWEMAYQSIA